MALSNTLWVCVCVRVSVVIPFLRGLCKSRAQNTRCDLAQLVPSRAVVFHPYESQGVSYENNIEEKMPRDERTIGGARACHVHLFLYVVAVKVFDSSR